MLRWLRKTVVDYQYMTIHDFYLVILIETFKFDHIKLLITLTRDYIKRLSPWESIC